MISNNYSQSVVPGPAASASSGKTLDVQVLKLYPRPIDWYTAGVGPGTCFNKPSWIQMQVGLKAIHLKDDICTACQRFFQEPVFAINTTGNQGPSDWIHWPFSIIEHLQRQEHIFSCLCLFKQCSPTALGSNHRPKGACLISPSYGTYGRWLHI